MGKSDVELLYFPINGRGLVARLILDYGKVDYNNKVLTFPEFRALKPSLPLGQLPVLKVDGMMYCQTQAINAYCGKLAKLPALSDIEELKNHMVNETTNEVFAAIIKPAFAAIGGVANVAAENDKKGELFFDAMEGVLADQLKNIEKVLKTLGVDGEIIPGKRTTADFNIANIYVVVTTKSINGGAKMIKETPILKKVMDGLVTDEKLGPLIEAAQNVQFFPFSRGFSNFL